MDTAADILLQAATLIGSAALDEASKQAVGDAWGAAKSAIKRKFGIGNLASVLIDDLPDAAGNDTRMATIQAQLAPLHLERDAEVLKAIEDLAATIRQYRLDAQAPAPAQAWKINIGAEIVNGPQFNNFNN